MSALRNSTIWCSGRKFASTGESDPEWNTSDPVSAIPHRHADRSHLVRGDARTHLEARPIKRAQQRERLQRDRPLKATSPQVLGHRGRQGGR
jgi:hypothetical protein